MADPVFNFFSYFFINYLKTSFGLLYVLEFIRCKMEEEVIQFVVIKEIYCK